MPLKIQNSTGTAEIVSSSTGGNNRTITLPDANTTLVGTDTTQTLTNKTVSGPSLLVNSNTGSGVGYSTGAGGAVTQITSKSTAVTLNSMAGRITMNNASLAASATVAFAVNNTTVGEQDVAIFSGNSGAANWGNYNWWTVCNANVITVYVRNVSGSPLSEALVFNFAIIKGATS